ncbi:hypothetical protein ACFTWQ_34660 [[Kitasatospora] papulosa]|uniref:hypothetical protein n=1 Tax=[Kitasatospora] papulosa TaxID=1464011 RepID=UPI0036349D5E
MIWETAEGKVDWSFSEPPKVLTEGTHYLIPSYITCKYKDKQRIAVYERRFKHFTDVDEWFWASMNIFLMLDNWGRVILESEEADNKINSLFNVAKDSASKVNDIIKGLLEED